MLYGVEQFVVTTLPITVIKKINLMMVFREYYIIPKICERVKVFP